MIYAIVKAIALFVFKLFGRLKIKYNYPMPEGGVILAGNHISNLDPPVLACASKRPVYFLAKKELFKNPVIGAILRAFKAYPLDRSKGDLAAIKRALTVLKEDKVLGIFPEGTRVKGAAMGKPLNGAAFLATQAKVPIVPVAVSGTELGFKGLFLGKIKMAVVFGKPITVEEIQKINSKKDLDKHQKLDIISNEIMDRIRQTLEDEM
ncbi:MAG: lysophospholipid acyltransferase family protein [Firmicutes bacterium]|nr:lysophospholipid acyltransferase family protein [Bacillota bacterium]MDD4264488.1 lysophospholipid acyltransferase family protein [Bacillota bacterium]MDD4693108.1 lysophospholipid acyltransferase family protein [Bacillota bacterium]